MQATLIADDLTGACDAGALFAARGRVGVFWGDASPGAEWPVVALDTDSRYLDGATAAERVHATARRLASRLAGQLVFKKIDSTLRGSVGTEIEALLSATGRRAALVCPAFPAQGRTVVDGVLRVRGEPVHRSAIGQDPAYRGGSSDVAGIVGRGVTRCVSLLGLAQVRGSAGALVRALRSASDHIVAADAETDADLDRIAAAGLACAGLVLSGSAGLAGAVAARLGYAGARVSPPDGRAWLIVAGSLHPATRSQLHALEEIGVPGVRLDGAPEPDPQDLSDQLRRGSAVFIATGDQVGEPRDEQHHAAGRLAAFAARLLARCRPDLLVAIGGATAAALLHTIGAARLELCGAPRAGLALGEAVIPGSPPLAFLTKAGGFGDADLLVSLLKGNA
jgi:D-threonate/D-erythronate kinase